MDYSIKCIGNTHTVTALLNGADGAGNKVIRFSGYCYAVACNLTHQSIIYAGACFLIQFEISKRCKLTTLNRPCVSLKGLPIITIFELLKFLKGFWGVAAEPFLVTLKLCFVKALIIHHFTLFVNKVRAVGGILDTLFEKQYILTERVTTETRYRTETRTGTRYVTDPETGESYPEEYEYDVEVPYTYYIYHVELENFNLSHVPIHIMSHDQLSMYAVYMSTLGNRPDLFADSAYVNRYYHTEYEKYEIPPEALADEQFAAVIAEAEKYLGFPHVWGGSSPATSFDCSGFVLYVYNNCGLHWDFGRLGAEGLRSMSAYVSPANAKPGDLIFFEKTYNTSGASHVGIYVGNNMMLHCGDPIQYASIDISYWRSHFLQFGRLP